MTSQLTFFQMTTQTAHVGACLQRPSWFTGVSLCLVEMRLGFQHVSFFWFVICELELQESIKYNVTLFKLEMCIPDLNDSSDQGSVGLCSKGGSWLIGHCYMTTDTVSIGQCSDSTTCNSPDHKPWLHNRWRKASGINRPLGNRSSLKQ